MACVEASFQITLAFMFRLLVECLVDAGKENDAADFSKVTSDFIEQHTPELYPRIFSIQVNHLHSPLVNCTVYYILPTQLSPPGCLGLSNMLPNETCIFPFFVPLFFNLSVPQLRFKFYNHCFSLFYAGILFDMIHRCSMIL